MTTDAPANDPSRGDTRHLVSASALVTGLGLLAKIIGVVRESASAAIFGANRAMDTFFVAKTLPDAFSTWIEGPVRAAFVPLFTRRMHEESERAAWRAASNVLTTLALLLTVVVAVLVFVSPWLIRLLAPGFDDPAAWAESTELAQILVISVLFSVIAVILGSLQNIYRRQAFPALGQVLNGLVVLAAVVGLGPVIGLHGYAAGILGGAVVACLLQCEVLWRHRRDLHLVCQPLAPEVREVVAKAFPLFIGLTGTRIDVFLDRAFASFLPEGRLSVLSYATLLSSIGADLVLTVSSMVWLPHFAHLVAERRFDEVKRRLAQVLGGYLFVMMPVCAVLCGGPRPIVDLLFQRGNFNPDDAFWTSLVLPILALGAPVFGVGQIVAQVHISRGDTKTPMWVGFYRIGFKAVLSLTLLLLLPLEIGFLGLAASSTVSSFLRTVLLWRRLPGELRPDARPFGRMVLALGVSGAVAFAAVMALAFYLPPLFPGIAGEAARVVVIGAAALSLHLVISWLFRNELLQAVVDRFLRRSRGEA